jgi:hypothetical protein
MSVMKGTVRLTVLITIARDMIGKKWINGTNIVDMLVTQTLIVKIYFRPKISNRKPNSKQLNDKEIIVVSKMICLKPKTKFTERIRNITKS